MLKCDRSVTDSAHPSGCVEFLDDRIRKACEIVQRGNDSLALGEQNFIERYISMKLNLGYRCAFGEFSNLGFIIHANKPGIVRDKRAASDVVLSDTESSGRGMACEQSSMLSLNVEIMQENKAAIAIASTIRFQRFDDCSFGRGEARLRIRTPCNPCR
jgi:hypothetical protein